jgi:hypothetical protein
MVGFVVPIGHPRCTNPTPTVVRSCQRFRARICTTLSIFFLFSKMTTTCSFSFTSNPTLPPVPVPAVSADAVLFCEVRTVDRFDTHSLLTMSFESTFNSSFNDDIDQWAKLIINNHVVDWDKNIGLEVICYPAVKGDIDLDLDPDDDDDCCWALPFPIANGVELNGEERSCVTHPHQ